MDKPVLKRLSDAALVDSARSAVGRERVATCEVIVHIMEIESRRLHLRAGYSSLRDWCVSVLGISEDAAYKRIQAAHAAQRVPAVLVMLDSGELTLSAVVTLAPVMTPKNARELLASASKRTKREVQALVAERFPQADLPTRVQMIAQQMSLVPEPVVPSDSRVQVSAMGPLTPTALRPKITSLAPGRVAWQLTVDQETHALFEELKALLAHVVPTGDMASVLRRALESGVADAKKRKFGVGVKCRKQPSVVTGRSITDSMKQQVVDRDGARCSFVGDGGRRCGSSWRLEFDHVVPVALGGATSADNLRVLCRRHNQYEAERLLGGERRAKCTT